MLLIGALGVTLAACGDARVDSPPATAGTTSAGDSSATPLSVVAGFYPLAFVAERVGGDAVTVTNLTPPGVEPHDLELSAREVARVHDADLVVTLAGFAPALDEAVATLGTDRHFDVTAAARLTAEPHDDGHGNEHAEHEADHDDGHAHDADHGHLGDDPHFWLDPTRLADVATALADQLGRLAPERAPAFTERAAALSGELAALDAEFTAELAACTRRELVTAHAAFGHLADRYGFTQVGIAGVSPDEEPSPATLADVTDYVRQHGVTTIYTETLVDPAIAATIAAETGATTAVLDPLEGLATPGEGDYLTVMRANLAALVAGQGC